MSMLTLVAILAVIVLTIVGMWRVFEKAGRPGWAVLVPFYNFYVLAKIAGKSGWWMLLVLIPYIGWIFQIILNVDVAKSFNRGGGFGVGLTFLPFIFYPILGLGDSQYGVASQLEELEDIFA